MRETTRLAVTLGLMAALGASAVDIFLPALPAIAAELRRRPEDAQAAMVAFLAAFGLGHLVWGGGPTPRAGCGRSPWGWFSSWPARRPRRWRRRWRHWWPRAPWRVLAPRR